MEPLHQVDGGLAPRDSYAGLRLLVTLTADDEERLTQALALRLERLAAGRLKQRSPEDLFTVDEAAAYLRCKKQRIYDLHWQGRLPAKREGRRLLFTRRALDAQLEDA
jgi:excisionase family DNA binding protein